VGTDAEQLRREIETTRRDLSTDVDALSDKVNPRRIAQRRVGRARNTMTNLRERVMGTASDAGSSTSQGISSTVSGVGSAASSAASTAADTARSAASTAADTARSTGVEMQRRTEGNPLAAGLIAFGAGWLVSSLLPASEPEQRTAAKVTETARDAAQPLAQQAGQALSEMKEGMREPAQQAAQQVRSTASEAAGTIQDQTRSSASDVAGEARDAGYRVRGEATPGS
jgi:hypothetical protein